MELLNYRPIGKAALHRIAGLRKNKIEMVSETPECCKDCPAQIEKQTWALFPGSEEYQSAVRKCEACPNYSRCRMADLKKTPLYLNEKNKYGRGTDNGMRLKYTAIILWITYHMLCSDKDGMIQNLSIQELAAQIGCSPKAIRYNNDLLRENRLIDTVPGDYPGMIHVRIVDYRSYFLDAGQGGRGFYTMTQDVYRKLLGLKGTNQLRIMLKVILDADNRFSNTDIVQGYRDIHSYLPEYCKRNVIKRAVSSISATICDISTTSHYVRFRLDAKYNTKSIKKRAVESNLCLLKKDVGQICADIKEAISTHLPPSFKNAFFYERQKDNRDPLVPLTLTESDYGDLASISLSYTPEMVIGALSEIYYDSILRNVHIRSLGAVVRQHLKLHTQMSQIL